MKLFKIGAITLKQLTNGLESVNKTYYTNFRVLASISHSMMMKCYKQMLTKDRKTTDWKPRKNVEQELP